MKFGADKCIWYQQSHSASKSQLSCLCSSPHKNSLTLNYKKKIYHNVLIATVLHTSSICIASSRLSGSQIEWYFLSCPGKSFFSLACCSSDNSIIDNFNSTAENASATSPHVPQENPLN